MPYAIEMTAILLHGDVWARVAGVSRYHISSLGGPHEKLQHPLCLSLGRVRAPFFWTIFVGTQLHFSKECKVPEKSNMPPSPKLINLVPKLTQAKPQDSSQNKPQRGSSPVP